MRWLTVPLAVAMLAGLPGCCGTRRSVTLVKSPAPAPMQASLMAAPQGPPAMPDRGSETGETGFLWADMLLDWGADLAHRLAALQRAVREREAGVEDQTSPPADETAGRDG